jgi:hypothetical protein
VSKKFGELIGEVLRLGVEINMVSILHQAWHPLGELHHHALLKDASGELWPGRDLRRALEYQLRSDSYVGVG